MVQAIITLGEHENRILTIVKGKYGLKNKSEAVNLLIDKYEDELLEPQLRPEYVKKLKRIEKQEGIKFKNMEELRKIIEGINKKARLMLGLNDSIIEGRYGFGYRINPKVEIFEE